MLPYVIDGGWGGADARNSAVARRLTGGQGLSGGRRLRAPDPRGGPARGAVRYGHRQRRRTRRPLEPQAVLTRLRAAAVAPGPLTVFVAGQLQLDRRQHLPHLALARSTPSTVRYNGFPWHWIREELRLRAPGSTSLVLDLHADHETWRWLLANPLDSGRNHAVYGRIAAPPNRRTLAGPAYMKAVATLLRSGHRPPLDQLHQQALSRIAPEAGVGIDIVLTAQGPVPSDPHAVITSAVETGGTQTPTRWPPGTSRPPSTPMATPPRRPCTGARSARTWRCWPGTRRAAAAPG